MFNPKLTLKTNSGLFLELPFIPTMNRSVTQAVIGGFLSDKPWWILPARSGAVHLSTSKSPCEVRAHRGQSCTLNYIWTSDFFCVWQQVKTCLLFHQCGVYLPGYTTCHKGKHSCERPTLGGMNGANCRNVLGPSGELQVRNVQSWSDPSQRGGECRRRRASELGEAFRENMREACERGLF